MICSFQAYSKSDHNRMPGNEFGSAKWGEVRAFNEKYAARTEETKSGLSPENKVLPQTRMVLSQKPPTTQKLETKKKL